MQDENGNVAVPVLELDVRRRLQARDETRLPIPSAIWLNAQRIEIEQTPDLIYKEDARGHAAFREFKIRLQSDSEGNPRPLADLQRCFLHEVVHWILHVMSEDELCGNEKFVDVFARYLHQSFVMAEYE